MKKLILFLYIFLGCSLLIAKADSITNAKFVEYEQRIQQLEQSLHKVELKSDYSDFVDSKLTFLQWFVSALVFLLSGVAGLTIWSGNKSLKALREEYEREYVSEVKNLQNKFLLKLSSIIEQDPIALNIILNKQIKDIENISQSTIRILYLNKPNSFKYIDPMGFKSVECEKITKDNLIERLKSSSEDIILLSDDDEQICKLVQGRFTEKMNKNIFYFGTGRCDNIANNQLFANSGATLPERLAEFLRVIKAN